MSTTPSEETDQSAQKAVLHRYLRSERDALRARLDGLSERDMRRPLTPTGTNLLGLVKHAGSIELDYFGVVFGRPSGRPLPWLDDDAPLNADMWATADESSAQILELYDFAAAHSDETIDALELANTGSVPWWPAERATVTLQQILIHVAVEFARHAGHADIVRELIDGTAGDDAGNLPDQSPGAWQEYRALLERTADEAETRWPNRIG